MQVQRNLGEFTVEALAMLGADELAYVKQQQADGQVIHVIHAANGKELGGFASREVAFAACRQHGLEPVSVH
ncbi:MAG: DUF1150 family protein [Alphaproteobacteria bacterium]|jgi:hypothetical protein|nr:DUF1150 family protein [Alphaproteobacteria bacterium]MDP6563611.1 DUF1150 family protein [Alphaproteobacteria bacterium]MDP6815076.1 DUF1150 family protein [Alphaproteobacteria bacterium]